MKSVIDKSIKVVEEQSYYEVKVDYETHMDWIIRGSNSEYANITKIDAEVGKDTLHVDAIAKIAVGDNSQDLKTEFYYASKEDVVFFDGVDSWLPINDNKEAIGFEELSLIVNYVQYIDSIDDYMDSFELLENTETVDGVSVYVIEGEIDANACDFPLFLEVGYGYSNSFGSMLTDTKQLAKDIKVHIRIYVDKKTYEPLGMDLDYSELIQVLAENLGDMVDYLEISADNGKNMTEIRFSGFEEKKTLEVPDDIYEQVMNYDGYLDNESRVEAVLDEVF